MLTAGDQIVFLLIAALTLLTVQAGFAFRQMGSVRRKNQANALVTIIASFAISILTYIVVGYPVAYGFDFKFLALVSVSAEASGYEPVRLFLLLALAAAVPSIIAGAVAERVRFWPQLIVTAVIVGLIYPFYEGIVWTGHLQVQHLLVSSFGAEFHDFSGSVTVHAMGGWLALAAVMMLGPRIGCYEKNGELRVTKPSSLPFLALGSWMLVIGWLSLNVMGAHELEGISEMVAVNGLMAIIGGVLGTLVAGRNDPRLVHHGALAGLIAICAASDIVHPIGGFIIGVVAGVLLVAAFKICQIYWKADDVVGVWPLHGVAGAWGGLACGIFGHTALGGRGSVSFMVQLLGTIGGIGVAIVAGFIIYGLMRSTIGMRLTETEELQGADVAIHSVSAAPEEDND